jgi:hypothetical protein
MENEEKKTEESAAIAAAVVGEMHKQRQTMPDGKRYIIFYAFGAAGGEATAQKGEVKENV